MEESMNPWKSLVECFGKNVLLSILSSVGSTAAPHEATLKGGLSCVTMPCRWTRQRCIYTCAAGRSELGLGINVHGIHIISLAARPRTATRSNTLTDAFVRIEASSSIERVTLHAFCTIWAKTLLHLSMAYSTVEALCGGF